MEAVVIDAKYRPAVLFPNGGPAVVVKKMRPAAAGFESVYRECLKNHAAALGGYAVDGCGEFMPSSDPAASLKCAACGCHRSFHRRLPELPPSPPLLAPPYLMHRGEETPEDRRAVTGDDDGDTEDSEDEGSDYDDDDRLASPLPAVMPSSGHVLSSSGATQMLLSLSTSASITSATAAMMAARLPGPRKRFRTRFSPEQKQKMQALSERLGWRLKNHDEAMVDDCCREIGIAKAVFKVWMHNNKHNFLAGHSARRSASADINMNNSSVQPATASAGSGSPRSS